MNDSSTPSMWDAVVVGAGLGALTAAAYLATNGQKVLVLEQYDVLGGSSHAFRRRGKWEFDVGVHFIENAGPDGIWPFVLSGIGLKDRIEFRQLDPEGHNVFLGPDFELKVPHGWDRYLDNLIAAFPGEERALRRYVSLMRAAGSAIDRLGDRLDSVPALLRAAGRAAPYMFLPYPAVLAMLGLSPRAITVLSTEACDYASTPYKTVFGQHAQTMNEFVSGGAWYPIGGGQALSANLSEVIRAHGGTIRTGVTVEQILVERREVTGVRLGGGEIVHTRTVVSGADIKRTMLELVGPEQLPASWVVRAKAWKMSWPFLNTYFGLDLDLRDTPNANYYVIPTWEGTRNLRQAAGYFPKLVSGAHRRNRADWLEDFTDNMTAFVHSATVRDPDNPFSAPSGGTAVEAMTLVPHDGRFWGVDAHDLAQHSYRSESTYQDMKERLTDAMLDRVERAFPGARANVSWAEAGTPATQVRYTRTTNGTSFGLEPSITQFGPARPGSLTPIRGLLLAGTSTRWGPGTTGAAISGMRAAGAAVCRDLIAEVRDGRCYADASLLPPHGPDWDPLRVARVNDVVEITSH